jgi:hypothetical protein
MRVRVLTWGLPVGEIHGQGLPSVAHIVGTLRVVRVPLTSDEKVKTTGNTI